MRHAKADGARRRPRPRHAWAAAIALLAAAAPLAAAAQLGTPSLSPGSTCVSCNLAEADLSGADLRRVSLVAANLAGADLSGADLSGANLVATNLSGAELDGTRLTATHLTAANLAGADLRGAELTEATLRGVNLSGADMRGAVGLTQDQLDDACGDAATRLPEGLTVPECGSQAAISTDDGGPIGRITLELRGTEGVGFDADCTVYAATGDQRVQFNGVVPARRTFEGRGLSCSIRHASRSGALRSEVRMRGNTIINTTASGGTLNFSLR